MWSKANNNIYNLSERWQNRLGQQPYQFQQISDNYSEYSPSVWIQQEREELALLLKNQVDHFNFWVGYSPYPKFFSETISLVNGENSNLSRFFKTSKSSKLIEFGTLGKELIGVGNVTYTNDTATITLPNTPLIEDEIAIVFRRDEFGNSTDSLNYRIHNLVQYHNGTDYIFVGHKSLLVNPEKQNSIYSFINGNYDERNALDKDDSANFVTQVNIYRLYTNTTDAAKLLSIDYSNNTISESSVNVSVTNGEFGEFRITDSSLSYSSKPIALKISYKAGYPLQSDNNILSSFESIILRRAKVELPISVREVSYRTSTNWNQDANSIFSMDSPNYYANPLGDRVIDYHTWMIYKTYADKFFGNASLFTTL